MEKVIRLAILAAVIGASAIGSATDSPQIAQRPGPPIREYPELTGNELAQDSAAYGLGPSSPEFSKIRILAAQGVEITARIDKFGFVRVGRFSLKGSGSGERGYSYQIKVEDLDLLGLREGEYFHAFLYPFRIKDPRVRAYYLSPAMAYSKMKEARLPMESVLLQDRQLWGPFAAPETPPVTDQRPLPVTDEQRRQARAALQAKRAAAGLPPARIEDFTTLDGKRYVNAIVSNVEADGVTIEMDSGVTKLSFANLPPEKQEEYGYDEAKAKAAMETRQKAIDARAIAMAREVQRAAGVAKSNPPPVAPVPAAPTAPVYSAEFENPDMATIRKYVLESIFPESADPATRWNQVPLVSSIGATDHEQWMFLDVIDEINGALGKAPMKLSPGKVTVKLSANQKTDEGAAIHVYFCDSKQVPAISAKEHIRYSFRQGVAWNWWNDDRTLKRSVVVIPRNQMDDDKDLRQNLLKQMMQAIGLRGSPKAPLRSIYTLSEVEKLQPNDVRLIGFLYGHVSAGMNSDQVRQAVNQFWDENAQAAAK